MKKKTDDVHALMDVVQVTYEKMAKILPAAIEAAQKKVDVAESELLKLKSMLEMIPTVEVAVVANKPVRRRKIARVAKKKAAKLQSLSDQLKELRAKAGLSQAAVARKAKLPQSSLCQIETGKRVPTDVVLKKIAKAYKVPVASLKTPEGAPVN